MTFYGNIGLDEDSLSSDVEIKHTGKLTGLDEGILANYRPPSTICKSVICDIILMLIELLNKGNYDDNSLVMVSMADKTLYY